ncbi:MAG: PH domain-containing protein, partial [Planctomycetales bacterium]
MNCPKCDTELPFNAHFCHRCGASLEEPGEEGASFEASQDATKQSGKGSEEMSAASDRPRDKFKPTGADGEEDREIDLWRGGYSPKAMIPCWLGAGLLTVVAIVVAFSVGATRFWWLVIIGSLFLIGIFLFLRLAFLKINYRYHLTNQRFIHETGILRRVTNRIEVIDIDDVQFEQGLLERLVGVGTIRMTSSDHSHPKLILKGIEDVEAVSGEIYSARRQERTKRGLHIET